MQVATRSLHARCACCGRAASQGAAHPSSPRRQHRIGARHARHVPQPTGCRAQAARHRSRQLCSPLGRGPQAGRWQGAPHAGARTPSSMAGPYAMTMSLPRRGGTRAVAGPLFKARARATGLRPAASGLGRRRGRPGAPPEARGAGHGGGRGQAGPGRGGARPWRRSCSSSAGPPPALPCLAPQYLRVVESRTCRVPG